MHSTMLSIECKRAQNWFLRELEVEAEAERLEWSAVSRIHLRCIWGQGSTGVCGIVTLYT
jgi:hypothetical protein